jgi:hypothetical protein
VPRLPTFDTEVFASVFGLRQTESDNLAEQRKALLRHWSLHPWNWLTGEDLVEREIVPGLWSKKLIWTTDEKDDAAPIKPFPNYEYLYRWIHTLHTEKEILANKPRQMIFTTSTLLYGDYMCLFRPARNVLLSKQTRDLAEQLLLEKVRNVHARLPEWVQAELPITESPANKIRYPRTRSTFRAVAQNAAERDARGGTATMVIIDEAAAQDAFQDIWSASTPMCDKVVGITTAQFGTRGGKAFVDMLDKGRPEHLVPELLNPDAPWPEKDRPASAYAKRLGQPLKAYSTRKTSRGFVVVELALQADPAKRSNEVLAEMERRQPNRRGWMMEFLGDWTTASGSAYYPEFDYFGGIQTYVHRCTGLIRGVPVERGWDFGIRTATVSWQQRDPSNGRKWLLRELLLRGADTYVLRDLVLLLSGQLRHDELSPKSADQVYRFLDALARDERMPPAPWFQPGVRFRDWSSREALHTTATVEGEEAERYDAAVLEARGIFLTALPVSVKARENMVRQALKPMPDGLPGLLIDPACPESIRMFAGGLVFAKETPSNPMPDEPQRDGWFHDLNDGIGYAIVGATETVSDRPVGLASTIPFRSLAAPRLSRPSVTESRRDLWGHGRVPRRARDIYSRRYSRYK